MDPPSNLNYYIVRLNLGDLITPFYKTMCMIDIFNSFIISILFYISMNFLWL
jgi:hypothetical protein